MKYRSASKVPGRSRAAEKLVLGLYETCLLPLLEAWENETHA
jgi:hypothetical protein